MRLLASIALAAGLALLAGPGLARPKPQPPPAAEGLRGPETVAPKKPLRSTIPKLASTAYSPALAPGPAASDSCRPACSRSYYFCLASDTPEQCPGQWIQCRSSCASGAR